MLDDLMKMRTSSTRSMRNLDSDDLLSALGLERKGTALENALPPALAFVAGLAAGAGVALLLAPRPGRETRHQIASKASELSHKLGGKASELAQDVRKALPTQDNDRSNRSPSS